MPSAAYGNTSASTRKLLTWRICRGMPKPVWDAEHTSIPIGVEDPVISYYSPTAFGKGVAATQALIDGINQIIVGHDSMSNYDQLVKDWRAAAGDQMRKEYLDAVAKAKQ